MSKVFYLEIEKADGNITVFNPNVIDEYKIDFENKAITLTAYKGSHRESKIRICDLKSAEMYSKGDTGYNLGYEVIDCEVK